MKDVQDYIVNQLEHLREITSKADGNSVDFLFKTIMSKKFRKYAVNPEYQEHIRSAIELNVKNKEPVKVTIVFGGYKLWRFEEAPEPDWAELFSMIYYANWLKPVADNYEPGVWFDFYSDDVIVKHIDNISEEETKKYREVFQELLDFMKGYLPDNFKMTLNRVGDQYESEEEFLSDVEAQKQKLLEENEDGRLELTNEQKETLNLNVRLTDEQKMDSNWQEKVQLVHDAYMRIGKRRPYYRTPDKIVAITKQLDNTIAVGTTKTSIAKFWPGVGALKRKDGGFIETILTPNQLASTELVLENVNIEGLSGKNFKVIRVVG